MAQGEERGGISREECQTDGVGPASLTHACRIIPQVMVGKRYGLNFASAALRARVREHVLREVGWR